MAKITSRPVRVVVSGGESTGKTTLAEQLGKEYGAPVLPEYLRKFVATKGSLPDESDVSLIAIGHLAQVSAASPLEAELLIFDTDLVSTVTYQHFYFGSCPSWIEGLAVKEMADLYLVCDIDIPYTPDAGMRDSEEARDDVQAELLARLRGLGANIVLLSGSLSQRTQVAIKAINEVV